ncbi:MAG: hypothetical protein ABJC39_08495, partial [Chloroflexota bacterium]
MLLVLSITGVAAAANLVTDTTTDATVPTQPAAGGTTFTDVNGDGIADTCQAPVVADAAAVTAAMAAVDTNADGTISVDEAAHSGWTGGANCNHGGYVSGVAGTSTGECDTAEAAEAAEAPDTETDETNEDSTDGDQGAAPKADAVPVVVVPVV